MIRLSRVSRCADTHDDGNSMVRLSSALIERSNASSVATRSLSRSTSVEVKIEEMEGDGSRAVCSLPRRVGAITNTNSYPRAKQNTRKIVLLVQRYSITLNISIKL